MFVHSSSDSVTSTQWHSYLHWMMAQALHNYTWYNMLTRYQVGTSTSYRIYMMVNWCPPSTTNRQICPRKRVNLVSAHRFSPPTRPPNSSFSPPAPCFVFSLTSPSPHRLCDLQDILNKLIMNFLLLHTAVRFVPSKTGFIVSAHRFVNITLFTPVQAAHYYYCSM